MNKFEEILKKDKRRIIGMISGTSADAIDTVLIDIEGYDINTKIEVLDFISVPIRKEIKELIFKCSVPETGNVEEICKLNFLLGRIFAKAAIDLINKNGLEPKDIDLIGSHGQTIYHYPIDKNIFGINVKSTLQISDPSVIANLTGITTIGDFRNADVALMGDGAPLVPYLDYILFRSAVQNRLLVNIGGISNLTMLLKNCGKEEVMAFDTGPGNMVIDALMRIYYNTEFDMNGEIALSGKINDSLFNFLKENDIFVKQRPPKSTGREYYGDNYVNAILNKSGNLEKNDVIRTVTDFTTYAIFHSVKNYLQKNLHIEEILVSGGGALNDCIMNSLKKYFPQSEVKRLEYRGINTDNKEAVLFAVLANETINYNPSNILAVTNAEKNVILGKICLAYNN
jgi:anhydro-N-acetylmuramic acid kinase